MKNNEAVLGSCPDKANCCESCYISKLNFTLEI